MVWEQIETGNDYALYRTPVKNSLAVTVGYLVRLVWRGGESVSLAFVSEADWVP